MLHILLLTLAVSARSQTVTQLDIRVGVSQLQMGALQQATYSILFNAGLPDSVYNSMVSVSYATGLDISHGLVISSACPNMTQTKMGCSVTANGNNQNNIVYFSYVASDFGSLLVGGYSRNFSFATTNSISETLTFKPAVDPKYINSTNALQIYFYPMLAGVSSLDGDFSFSIDSSSFNSLTLEISVAVTIKEMHAKNITIYLSYLLFDVSRVTITRMAGQRLTPDNIADGFIYGLSDVIPRTTARRLQVVSPKKTPTNPTSTSTPSSEVKATNAATVKPIIRKHVKKTNATNSTATTPKIITTPVTVPLPTPSAQLSPSDVTPKQASQLAQTLRSNPSQIAIVPKTFNAEVFSAVKQADGVIDADSAAVATLQEANFFVAAAAPLVGVDNQLFNSLFSSNGFVIVTTADDVDQIYHFDILPVQPTTNATNTTNSTNTTAAATTPTTTKTTPTTPTTSTASAAPITGASASTLAQNSTAAAIDAPAQVFYEQVVTNVEPPVVCPKGVVVGKEKQVSYIQQKPVLTCLDCPAGTYLDTLLRTCKPSPKPTNLIKN